MHHNVFYETNVAISHGAPELVYRHRGPPLSMLHNAAILGRSRNIMTELQREYSKYEIVNSLAPISLGPGLKGFVGPCGFNHTELEVVCVGGQGLHSTLRQRRDTLRNDLSRCPSNFSSLAQCFSDILETEYPNKTFGNVTASSATGSCHSQRSFRDYDACHRTAELGNGRDRINSDVFRFKRLSHFRSRSFGTNRVAEVRVDDKMTDRPLIYARNHDGCVIARLTVSPWDDKAHQDKSGVLPSVEDSSEAFPSVVPYVVADMPFSLDNTMTSMFVSPHDYGIWATTTRKRQLVVWDSTVSAPCSKVDLFKSSERHLSYGEMYSKWSGGVASDTLDCGTFTDRHDVVLVAGSKVYVADLRSRALGSVFPTHHVRPPSTYRFPKLNTRLPVPDRFLAIERHPSSPSLYGLISGVSSSVLLWDLRNPSQVIAELPLPLLRQGRGRYRSLQWQHIPAECAPQNDKQFYFLSAFCWEHNAAAVNVVSIFDSSSVLPCINDRELLISDAIRRCCASNNSSVPDRSSLRSAAVEATQQNTVSMRQDTRQQLGDNKTSSAMSLLVHRPGVTPSCSEHPEQQHSEATCVYSGTEPTEFWSICASENALGRSPFYVNPFHLFHSPRRFALPVCDPSGLCFSSNRPPVQVVVYQQVQLPIGVPTITSEKRYFSPLGPIITCSETLINEGLHTSVAEAPLSQLFHGLAGIHVLALPVPNNKTGLLELTPLILGLSFSGRLMCARLRLTQQKRSRMFSSKTNEQNLVNSTEPNKFSSLSELNFPVTERSKAPGLLPHLSAVHQLLSRKQHISLANVDDGTTKCCLSWDPLRKPVRRSLNHLLLGRVNDSMSSSVFSRDADERIYHYNLRGLHELLRPNNDSLDHRTFLITPKMNFVRQRTETVLFWRRPNLNGIYFAQALLDMLFRAATIDTEESVHPTPPIQLPTITAEIIKKTQVFDAKQQRRWASLDEAFSDLDTQSMANRSGRLLTLGELFAGCTKNITRQELVNELKKRIESGNLICWITSTGCLDLTPVELLPFSALESQESLCWYPIAERIVTPLCSCSAIYHLKPLHLNSDETSQTPLWMCWAPQGEKVVFNNIARVLMSLIEKRPWKQLAKSSGVGQTVNRNTKTSANKFCYATLQMLSKALIGGELPGVIMPKLPVNSNAGIPANQTLTVPKCAVCDFSNVMCLLSECIVFYSPSMYPKEEESIVQGRRFIAINTQALAEATTRQQQFILDNSPRDYPAYFAFLTGVRVTEQLYRNLQKEWPSRLPPAPAACQALFQQIVNPQTRDYCVSSPLTLAHKASTAASDAARQVKTLDQQAIVGVLASHIKQPTGRRSLAAVLSGHNVSLSRPSQSLTVTLQKFSQEISTPIRSEPVTLSKKFEANTTRPLSNMDVPAILRFSFDSERNEV